MRLPILRAKSSREMQIPELFGGINLRDSVSMVNDNQFTDCLNMWKSDGMLKTRPGLKTDTVYEIPNALKWEEDGAKTFMGKNIKKHNIFKDGIKGKMQLCTAPTSAVSSGGYTNIYVLWIGANAIDCETLPSISFSEAGAIESYFIAEKGGVLYFYTNNQEMYKYDPNGVSAWVKLTEEDYYAPIVLAHCKPLSETGNVAKQKVLASGTIVEGYNIIGNKYRMIYSTVNVDRLEDEESTHFMRYTLLYNVNNSKFRGKKLVAKLMKHDGTVVEHEVTLPGSATRATESAFNSVDGYKLSVYGSVVTFYKSTSDGQNAVATVKMEDFVEDNLEIIAPYISTTAEKKKVFSMTRCEWFGGISAGLAGGTRLFLCGNRNSKEKGLVVWSGLNDPTYFSENSYFYVGNSTEAVKGFGKQQDMLVIFKERETWYTQYNQNANITGEDLINQSIVDYTASSVYFPLTQINPNIGCPYPASIQLCRNRLVWLGYDGAVHTLVSNNQYNERSIYTVSEMVRKKLKGENGKKVSTVDWNGYYCLCFGKNIYLMDYNCYGYNYISSYSKTEDANIQIPWYYWELPENLPWEGDSPMICVDNNLGFAGYVRVGSKVLNDTVERAFFNPELMTDLYMPNDGSGDVDTFIKSYFTTKLFEFGAPHIRKNVERINLQLGNNGAMPITVSLVTESGTEEQVIILAGNETESYSPAFIDSKAVFPCIRNVLRMGIKLSCDGAMTVQGMVLKYKFTGGAR